MDKFSILQTISSLQVTMKNLRQEGKIGERINNYQVKFFLFNFLTDDINVKLKIYL